MTFYQKVIFVTIVARLTETAPTSPSNKILMDPVCKPWCKNGSCQPANVTRLEAGVCSCARIMGYQSTTKLHLWTKSYKDKLLVSWEFKDLSRQGNPVLYLPRRDGSGVCFSISTQDIPSWASVIKLTCSQLGDIETGDSKLIDWTTFTNIAIPRNTHKNRRHHKKTNRHSRRKRSTLKRSIDCDCPTPKMVHVKQMDESTLEVGWGPFMAEKDMRVRMVKKGHGITHNRDVTITRYQLCRRQTQTWKFNNVTPGMYVATVGPIGCSGCVRYSQSPDFLLRPPEKAIVGAVSSVTVQTTMSIYESVTLRLCIPSQRVKVVPAENRLQLLAILTVGILAFVACSSITLICIKPNDLPSCLRRKGNSYEQVDTGKAFQSIAVVEDIQDVASRDISKWIYEQLSQSDRKVDLITSDQLETETDQQKLFILVSLKDVHDLQGDQDRLSHLRIISVLIDYTRVESPLVVRRPEGMDMLFQNLNNDDIGNRMMDLMHLMTTLCSGLQKQSYRVERLLEKTRDFIENRKNEIQKIFLVFGRDHSFHETACLELANLLRTLGKTVVSVPLRQELPEQEPLMWILKEMSSADLVLVVGSDHLLHLIQNHEHGKQMSDVMSEMYAPDDEMYAPMCIKLLANQVVKSRVTFVTFGYGLMSVDKILHPGLNNSLMRYDLSDLKWNVYGANLSLRMFLSRLSADADLVNLAISEAEMFLKNVEGMSAKARKGWSMTPSRSLDSLLSSASRDDGVSC